MSGEPAPATDESSVEERRETPLRDVFPGQSHAFLRDCRVSSFEACLASSKASSFAEAAKNLGIEESTLRKRVKAVERYFGVTLFKTRGALIVVPDAFPIIRDIEIAMEYLDRALRRPHIERLWSKVGRDYKKEINSSKVTYTVNANATALFTLHEEERS